MKKLFFIFCFLFFLGATYSVNAQSKWSGKAIKITKQYSEVSSVEKKFINEVFGDRAQELVWGNSKSEFRNSLIYLLRNRITIVDASKFKKQKSTLNILDVGLSNDFNPNLVVDAEIDINDFNPLKYKLDFFANGTYLYKIGDTPYYLQVESQHRKK